MFAAEVVAGMTSRQLLRAVEANHRAKREAECGELVLAAAWADDQDRDPAEVWPVQAERSTLDGGRGRLPVDEDAVAEFGCLIGVGMIAARNLIGDAVDLRLRFPLLWARIQTAGLPAWQARKVVQATHALSDDQAGELDARLSEHIAMMAWPRFERILGAAILDVDPDGVKARELRARTERFVRAHDAGDGLKLLIAKATSGDVTWFLAAVQRIAEILGEDGDTDPIDVRRSRAVGILGQPARAAQLIAAHSQPNRSQTNHSQTNHSRAEHTVTRAEDDTDPSRPDVQTEPAAVDVLDDETGDALPADQTGAAERTHQSQPSVFLPGRFADMDPKALRPKAVLYFHLSEHALTGPGGLVRPEHGGPLSLNQLRDFLADTGCQISVRPVITPADTAPVDHYARTQ